MQALNLKMVFLAVLLVTTVAVTISVAATSLRIPSIPERGFHKVADPVFRPMEPIDDESPPG